MNTSSLKHRLSAIVAAVAHRAYGGLSVEELGKKMVKGGAFIDVITW